MQSSAGLLRSQTGELLIKILGFYGSRPSRLPLFSFTECVLLQIMDSDDTEVGMANGGQMPEGFDPLTMGDGNFSMPGFTTTTY